MGQVALAFGVKCFSIGAKCNNIENYIIRATYLYVNYLYYINTLLLENKDINV